MQKQKLLFLGSKQNMKHDKIQNMNRQEQLKDKTTTCVCERGRVSHRKIMRAICHGGKHCGTEIITHKGGSERMRRRRRGRTKKIMVDSEENAASREIQFGTCFLLLPFLPAD